MKKVLLGVAFVFSALCSHAAYLYWQIDQSQLTDAGIKEGDWATLYATTGDPSSRIFVDGGAIGAERQISVDAYEGGGYSFYVEILNYDNAVVGVSTENTSYADLLAENSIVDTTLDVPMVTVWHGGAIAVPEPTSGFLMMVGLALLGLKRRKV